VALTLLIGGARSGKSELAVRLARAQSEPVTMIATGEPGDDEMAARIEQHRSERPAEWTTIEEPLELADAIANVPAGDSVIVDCLTLWTANMLAVRGAEATETEAARVAAAAGARAGLTVAVTNEVGLGIVPDHVLGREYRDLLGRVNTSWAAAAERAYLLVAGRALALSAADALIEGSD
jgi:adenosylcobinamide kinase / adenosylcobinamide-phosphate guanylyltransferase